MKLYTLAACIALTGCASGPPMSPQEAAIIMQMLGNQQAANAQAWQNMQSNPVFQRQQVAPVYVAPQPRPVINCTTTGNAYALYTNCR